MKKRYTAVDMEITEFDVEDIITNSGTGQGGSDDYDDGSIPENDGNTL